MPRSCFALLPLLASAAPLFAQPDKPRPEANAVFTALQFTHLYATPDALTPAKDRELKTAVIAALGRGRELPWDAAAGCFEKEAFRKLSGGKDAISVDAMLQQVKAKSPASRADLNAKTRTHAELLSTQFDQIDAAHHKAAGELTAWVVKNHRAGRPLAVVVICTKNTRRSALSAAMGNVAAAYAGLPDVRFHSGGTEPEAINPRTVATLKDIGLEVEPTGKEAARGKSGVENPIYRVRWGKGMEADEFSKVYTDPANPKDKFAALLVCGEADSACPNVAGATARIPVNYLDPKAFDGTAFEAAKYAERRDDIGRFMLCVLTQARRQLDAAGRLK